MRNAAGNSFAFWQYNLCLALPSGDAKAQKLIRSDHDKVAASMRKFTRPALDTDGNLTGGPAIGPRTETVTIEPGSDQARLQDLKLFAELNEVPRSRLAIFGHGDPGSQTVGGRTPEQLAKLLRFGCRIERVGKISLIACYAGGNFDKVLDFKDDDQLFNSFATQFFGQLSAKLLATSYMTARTGAMNFKGQRMVQRGGKFQHRAPHSKFAWTRSADGKTTTIEEVY